MAISLLRLLRRDAPRNDRGGGEILHYVQNDSLDKTSK